MPVLAKNVEQFLNIPPLNWDDANSVLPIGHRVSEYKHLMARVDQKQIAALIEANKETLKPTAPPPVQKQEKKVETKTTTTSPPALSPSVGGEGAKSPFINIDEFSKVDLRVARIASAEHVEGAEKLL